MSDDPTADFFRALSQGSHVTRLSRCTGSVRFEVLRPDGAKSWRVDIAKGDITVSENDGPADAIVRGDKAVMDGVFTGEVNAVAATLRGVLVVEGNWDLVLMCQRLIADSAFDAERERIEEAESA